MGPSEGPSDLVYQLERVALHVPDFFGGPFFGSLFIYLLTSFDDNFSFVFFRFFRFFFWYCTVHSPYPKKY